MEKYITFVLDSFDLEEYKVSIFQDTVLCESYFDTKDALDRKEDDIWTYDLAHLSFDLIDMGYHIVLAYGGKYLTCYPGMKTIGEKEIRKGHNLLKMLTGGYFNDDLGINLGVKKNSKK